MIIARQKRRENLAEYLLYMWQIEDLIRAFEFSLPRLKKEIIDQFQQPEEVKKQISEWYLQLIQQMQDEQITKTGHLRFLQNLLNELHDFHQKLLTSTHDQSYRRLYQQAGPAMQELASRVTSQKMNDIEICLTGLYGMLILRLGKKEISPDTLAGMKNISAMMAYLADQFRKYETGELEL